MLSNTQGQQHKVKKQGQTTRSKNNVWSNNTVPNTCQKNNVKRHKTRSQNKAKQHGPKQRQKARSDDTIQTTGQKTRSTDKVKNKWVKQHGPLKGIKKQCQKTMQIHKS